MSISRDIRYLCINKQFNEVINKYPNDQARILSSLLKYGTISEIEKYYPMLQQDGIQYLVDHVTGSAVRADFDKVKFLFDHRLVSEGDLYMLIKYNYKYIQFVKDLNVNVCQVIAESIVPFKYIIEEFVKINYTYEEMIHSVYKDHYMLHYLLEKGENDSDVIAWMNLLFNNNKSLLINFMRITYDYSIISDNSDLELSKKIIKYIKGRGLLREVVELDPFLANVLDICRGI